MPEPSPEELERLHAEIARLVQQATAVFDNVGLNAEEKAWAKEASQQIAHYAISLFTGMRRQQPRPKIRMLALSAAAASALAIVDGNARATDAFANR
jgi:hypothetical protein